MLPSSALAPLITRDRSREQPIVPGYATAPPETARSARSSYQQRVAVNHQLSSHWVGRLLSAKFARIMAFYVPNGGRCTYRIWCQLRAAVLGDRRMLQLRGGLPRGDFRRMRTAI